jgi:hypothetical protein
MSQIFLILFIISQLGCTSHQTAPEIEIAFKNKTDLDIDKVEVIIGEEHAGAGYLSSEAYKGSCCFKEPQEKRATVRWENLEGKKSEQELSLQNINPRGDAEGLLFTYKKEGWSVRYCESTFKCE